MNMWKRFLEWLWPITPEAIVAPAPIPVPPPTVRKPKRTDTPKGRCLVKDKRCFTEEVAKKEAIRLARGNEAQHMRAYKCEFCDWWHLTHKRAFRIR